MFQDLVGLMQRVRFEPWTDGQMTETETETEIEIGLSVVAMDWLDNRRAILFDRENQLREGFDALVAHQEQINEGWTELSAREHAVREREHAVREREHAVGEREHALHAVWVSLPPPPSPPPPPPPSQPRLTARQVGGWPASSAIRWRFSGHDQRRSRAAREERTRAAQEQRAAREAMEDATPRWQRTV